MFKDVESKIKGLAYFIFVLFCISAFVGFIVLLVLSGKYHLGYYVGIAFGEVIVLPLLGYVISLLIYGFGQLIDNTGKSKTRVVSSFIAPTSSSMPKKSSQDSENAGLPQSNIKDFDRKSSSVNIPSDSQLTTEQRKVKSDLDFKLKFSLITKEEYDEEIKRLFSEQE